MVAQLVRKTVSAVVLFGAGASAGSDYAGTPPLGAELFDALRRFNPPGWGAIPEDLAARFRRDFERGMEALSNTNPHAMPPLQRAMAAFFFNYGPQRSNLYLSLAFRLRSAAEPIALCTLNYERLLELSLGAASLRPCVGGGALSANDIELILPHGCCHIFCDAVRMTAGMVSFSGTAVTMDGSVSVVADPAQFRHRIKTDAVPPVMSYFEPRKATSAGRSFIESQRARWATVAASAKTVIVIGAMVRPSDAHIWGPLRETSARIVYCSGKRAAKDFQTWAMANRKGRSDEVLAAYFRDSFEAVCDALQL
jgi:hypothetical protein